jgi:hypothetical protein
MIPYNHKLLRCHPLWGQLRTPISDGDIHVTSHRKLNWMCCECNNVFAAVTNGLVFTSCRCRIHSKEIRTRKRPRHSGRIPLYLTRPIRAGLLQCVERDVLVDVMASLIGGDNRKAEAHMYIDEVSQCTRKELLDGGFWWDDTAQRKNGDRYKHLSAQKQQRVSQDTSIAPLTVPIGGDSRHPDTATKEALNDNQNEKPSIEDEVRLMASDNPTDHKWDDVLQAINDDLRAFWGLWNTVVLPRLDPNFPTDWEVMEMWDGEGVDIVNIWDQTEKLQAQVKKLIDERRTKPGEECSWRCLDGLVTSHYPEKSKICFWSFTSRIVAFGCTPCLAYPLPVD